MRPPSLPGDQNATASATGCRLNKNGSMPRATVKRVTSIPGVLIGNVWEWTSSKVSAYPGNAVVVDSSTQDWIAIRGGCYVSNPAKSDAPVTSCMREFVPPSTKTTLL